MGRSRAVAALVGVVLCVSWAAVSPASAADPAPTNFYSLLVLDGPPPVAGDKVWFSATLSSGVDPVVGRTVQLWVRAAGQREFTAAASAVTGARGDVEASIVLTRNSVTRWVFAGDAQYGASQTSDLGQRVETRVGAKASARSLSVGQRLVVRGRTFPRKPGHTVSLWSGARPQRAFGPPSPPATWLAKATVRADGSYRLVKRFGTPGKRRLFVRVSRGDGNLAGFSRYRWVQVG
jgi:hypothetical protein